MDYILMKDGKPVEPWLAIYSEANVLDLFKHGFKLEAGESFDVYDPSRDYGVEADDYE